MFDPKVEHSDIFFSLFFCKFRNILSFTFYLQPQSSEQLISFKVLPLPFIFFLLFVFLQGECNSLLNSSSSSSQMVLEDDNQKLTFLFCLLP